MSSVLCVPAKVSPDKASTAASEDLVVCGVIGPASIGDMPPCPCCNRRVSQVEGRQTLDEPTGRGRIEDIPCRFQFDDDYEEEDEDSMSEEEDDYLPGVLDSGVEYKFKRVLAEGWVNKKGTGKDWFGSRAWKPRWARLVVSAMNRPLHFHFGDQV